MGIFIRKSAVFVLITAVSISLFLIINKKAAWAGGFLTGAAWMSVNLLLTVGLLKIGLLEKNKKSMPALLMLKFPVLYLGGFFILTSKLFPVMSLLAGVTLVLLVAGVVKLCLKVT